MRTYRLQCRRKIWPGWASACLSSGLGSGRQPPRPWQTVVSPSPAICFPAIPASLPTSPPPLPPLPITIHPSTLTHHLHRCQPGPKPGPRSIVRHTTHPPATSQFAADAAAQLPRQTLVSAPSSHQSNRDKQWTKQEAFRRRSAAPHEHAAVCDAVARRPAALPFTDIQTYGQADGRSTAQTMLHVC